MFALFRIHIYSLNMDPDPGFAEYGYYPDPDQVFFLQKWDKNDGW